MNLIKISTALLMATAVFFEITAAEKISGTTSATQTTAIQTPVKGAAAVDSDLLALPNPARDRNDNIVLVYRTRCTGTATVTIYDAVGSMVYETATRIDAPNAVGHKIAIPWDCRNQKGRVVGNGTYVAVIQMFDPANRPVARHTANIGVAF